MDASKHFTATSDNHGGVTLELRPRYRFQDQPVAEMVTEIDPDGIARSKPTDENGEDDIENIVHIFGPLLPGQSAKLVKQDAGTIAVVLTSAPDQVLGNSVNGGTTDAPKTR